MKFLARGEKPETTPVIKEDDSVKLCKFWEVRSEENEISSLSDGKVSG